MITQKTWPPGGGVSFPYMEYIDKNLQISSNNFFSETTGRKVTKLSMYVSQVVLSQDYSNGSGPLNK